MGSGDYCKPEIKTLTGGQILEILGPVSCGSGAPLSVDGDIGSLSSGSTGGLSHLN